jgi:hypothetical protein
MLIPLEPGYMVGIISNDDGNAVAELISSMHITSENVTIQ